VGGAAQTKAMKKVAGALRLAQAKYRELAAFAQFGSDLDASTKAQLSRGARNQEALKQDQNAPLSVGRQVIIVWAVNNGYLDEVAPAVVRRYEGELYKFLDANHPEIEQAITGTGVLDDDTISRLKKALERFNTMFAA
jgi:F-type H+-transporting ATPase subunit alpha